MVQTTDPLKVGIDHELRLPDTQGRPVGLMDDGQPIMELFG